MTMFSHLWQYLALFFRECQTQFVFTNCVFENRAVYETMSKNMVDSEAADSMAHAHCMLNK